MKRKLITTAAAFTLLFMPCAKVKSYADENSSITIEKSIYGHINAETVNFRMEPNLDSDIYYTLDKYTTLEVISENGDWTKVIIGDTTGYVFSQYITKHDDTSFTDYEKMSVKATAYAGDTITSTGTTPKWGTIAVDPKVIPYGTKVYIPQFDKVFTAEDTGSAIKGNRIDIFMNSEAECNEWGVQTIDIYVLS